MWTHLVSDIGYLVPKDLLTCYMSSERLRVHNRCTPTCRLTTAYCVSQNNYALYLTITHNGHYSSCSLFVARSSSPNKKPCHVCGVLTLTPYIIVLTEQVQEQNLYLAIRDSVSVRDIWCGTYCCDPSYCLCEGYLTCHISLWSMLLYLWRTADVTTIAVIHPTVYVRDS